MDEQKKSPKKAERGKETLFRVTYNHQSKLIQIADYKANMIISVSTMVISAIVAIVGYGAVSGIVLQYGLKLIIPISIIVLTCLTSLVFAIQAARPKLIKSHKAGTTGHKSSLLFFGVIAAYTQQEYLAKMKDLLAAGDEMFEHMTIDIYYQGLILKRKYNLLVYAYQVLMYGFILSALIFIGFLLAEL